MVDLTIGMVACPRAAMSLSEAVASLRFGGFPETIHVFAEPGTAVTDRAGITVHRNAAWLGVPENFLQAVRWLLDHSRGEHVLMVEDDVAYCRGARAVLDRKLAVTESYGYVSLYTPIKEAKRLNPLGDGWITAKATDVWGAQAICFQRKSLPGLLQFGRSLRSHERYFMHDLWMAEHYQRQAHLNRWYHVPSLCDHIGWGETTITRPPQHLPNFNRRHLHRGLAFDPDYAPDPPAKEP